MLIAQFVDHFRAHKLIEEAFGWAKTGRRHGQGESARACQRAPLLHALTAGEAGSLVSLVEASLKALEVFNLDQRMSALEERIANARP
jgi:hypothetical protein